MSDSFVPVASDALIVVDVQNDFCPGGALAVPRGDEVVAVVNRLSPRFRHVVVTQDWHPRGHVSFASSHPGHRPFERIHVSYGEQVLWPDHCVPGTPGAELHAGLDTLAAGLVVRKGSDPAIDSYSAFYENDHRTGTGLAGYLRERGCSRLVLAGLATDFCVLYSALDGQREGFEVCVLEDGVRGIDLDGSLASAWDRMAEAGVRRIHSSDVLIRKEQS
jgi:nicotinamidase/pyrazinamidase